MFFGSDHSANALIRLLVRTPSGYIVPNAEIHFRGGGDCGEREVSLPLTDVMKQYTRYNTILCASNWKIFVYP